MEMKLTTFRLLYNNMSRKGTFYTVIIICIISATLLARHLVSFEIPITVKPSSKPMMRKYLSDIAAMVKVKDVNCRDLFSSSENTSRKFDTSLQQIGMPISNAEYVTMASTCSKFQENRGYIMSSLTEEEEQFPLAFSLIVYKDAEMVERLFRAIYRPQNYYCIHIDKKSTDVFYTAISSIIKCFPNAFITTIRIDILWGSYSVLEAELLCLKELWRFPKWKYFINLTGQEFPLKTNVELVRILKAYHGAVDVSTWRKRINLWRWKNTTPPNGLVPMKGPVHIVVHREFVDYILHNETAAALLNWTKSTMIPDETFFPTLNANPQLGIKGTYTGEPELTETRPYIARYKMRRWMNNSSCAGRYIRGVCILSTGDLPRLVTAREMFANKFFLHEDRLVIGCLEEKIFNDTRDEFTGLKIFNTSYYSQLDFVKFQVR